MQRIPFLRLRHGIAMVFGVVALLFSARVAEGQVRPNAGQAAQALQNATPDMIARLQAQLRASGMTNDQIRARLIAEGYPPSLLDQYLPGGTPDSTVAISQDVFSAVKSLGIGTDSLSADSLGTMEDSLGLDSLGRTSRFPVRPRNNAGNRGNRATDMADSLRSLQLKSIERVNTAYADSGYTIFGANVFNRGTTQFDANLAGPVPSNYQIGPGDQLVLILTGAVEASYTLPVTREGFVVIPSVGQVSVANLTMDQLNDVLYTRLGRVYSGVRRVGGTTHFQVSLSKLGTSQVSVLGDVKTPGSYRVSKLGTILTALYAANGPTENGDMRAVELRRDGQLVKTLDLYDYLLSGNASNDVTVQTGDIVFVRARSARARVAGPVTRPATYDVKANETLGDLIRIAGGFRPEADRRRVQIERILPPDVRAQSGRDRVLIDVASADIEHSAEKVQAGDVIHIARIANRTANRVVVQGDVWSPGSVAFQPGMRLSDALRRAGGLKPDAYLGAVQISRLQPDSSRKMLRAALRDTLGTPVQDLDLEANDNIQIFSLTDYRPKRYVAITGAVNKAGQFPYRDGMTLRDLVMLAGGVSEGALLTRAEVARMPENRANGAIARTIQVPLDSTYLFERTSSAPFVGPPGVQTMSSGAPEVPLEPYDNVLILRQADFTLPRTVAVYGEVKFPGRYTLTSKNERLVDIMERAGGLTQDAYANGIVFIRQRDSVGRIGLDLPKTLRDPRNVDNLLLVDKDSIFIPVYSGIVNVKGAINSPVAVAWVKGADIDYYVRSAGGATTKGDQKRAYVVQPSGKVESKNRHLGLWYFVPAPEAGSTVFVPLRDEGNKIDWASFLATSASILGSLVAIIAIAKK